MFTLNNKLETEVAINDKVYPVNMAFNNVMDFLEIVDNPELNDLEKAQGGIYQLLGEIPKLANPELFKAFHEIVIHFIQTGTKKEMPLGLDGNPMPVKKQAPIYDLKADAQYIYNSFRQAYGINLFEEQGKLDWREFMSLLRGLPEETEYKKVIDIRTKPYYKGKGMTEANRKLREAKRHYALPGVEVD